MADEGTTPPDGSDRVIVSGINIPFGNLAAFYIKALFAIIPAAIVGWILFAVASWIIDQVRAAL